MSDCVSHICYPKGIRQHHCSNTTTVEIINADSTRLELSPWIRGVWNRTRPSHLIVAEISRRDLSDSTRSPVSETK